MNTNTILIYYYYYYEQEKQQRFPQLSIKVALVCSLKPALDILPPIRGSVQKDALTVTSAAGEFSIRRAHGAPLDSIRLCVFLFSSFLFHFGGRLVFSSLSGPTERKPKREGVLRDESNLIALRNSSSRAVITRHFPGAETLVASFFGHVALTQRFRFRFRPFWASFVLVVERIRSRYGECLQHLRANF
jgi:hypothetical protein